MKLLTIIIFQNLMLKPENFNRIDKDWAQWHQSQQS